MLSIVTIIDMSGSINWMIFENKRLLMYIEVKWVHFTQMNIYRYITCHMLWAECNMPVICGKIPSPSTYLEKLLQLKIHHFAYHLITLLMHLVALLVVDEPRCRFTSPSVNVLQMQFANSASLISWFSGTKFHSLPHHNCNHSSTQM